VVAELARRAPSSNAEALLDQFDKLWSDVVFEEDRTAVSPEPSSDGLSDQPFGAENKPLQDLPPVMRIGELLRIARAGEDLTVREIADRSGFSLTAVAAYLNGETLAWTEGDMKRITKSLGMSDREEASVMHIFHHAKKLR
jgi:hypothetical protein